MALEQLCAACGVTVHDPTTIIGNPGGPHADHCLSAPITRIPVGDQPGLPSWIDHCASDGCVSESWIDWTDVQADHAAVVARCKLKHRKQTAKKRSTWVVSNAESAKVYAIAQAPTAFQSFEELHAFVALLPPERTWYAYV